MNATEARDSRPARGSAARSDARGGRRAAAAVGLCALLVAGAACRRRPPEPTLEVLVPSLPATLDPFADSRLVSRSIFTAIFEPLAEETAFGVRPAIADRWTNPAPDVWVFHIGSDSLFHDGSPVTSRQVVDAALSSRSATTSVAGLADLRAIEVVDERTVRFRTHAPSEDFLLAVSALFVPKPQGGTFLGTGPFRVVARTPDRIVLRRHERPRHAPPLLAEVVFRRFASSAEGLRLLRREVPAAALDPTPAMVQEARADPRYRVAAAESGGLTYLAVGFSAGAGPLEDVRVRRALRLALDLPGLVAAGALAGGTPSAQLIPPGAFGFDPARKPPVRDLAAARRLLAAAGLPAGFDAVLDVSPSGQRTGEALAAQVAEAGIRLRVAVHRSDAFVARIDGKSPLYIYSWFVGQDAGQALRNAFHTRDASRGLGTLNRTGWSRPELDREFAALAAAPVQEERLRRLRAISARLDEELPWIPLYSAREARILPEGLGFPARPDGLFAVAEARAVPAGR